MTQYITPPPDIPPFIYKHYSNSYTKLIDWAKKEHRDRLKFCAKHGYFKEWKRLHEDYSPIRILAEVGFLGKITASITPATWRRLSKEEQYFIIRAVELRVLLRQVEPYSNQ